LERERSAPETPSTPLASELAKRQAISEDERIIHAVRHEADLLTLLEKADKGKLDYKLVTAHDMLGALDADSD
jgi:hypothetical protein